MLRETCVAFPLCPQILPSSPQPNGEPRRQPRSSAGVCYAWPLGLNHGIIYILSDEPHYRS